MSRLTGKTKDGRESAHTLDNTGVRRFLVVEFDFQPEKEKRRGGSQATLFAQLEARGGTTHDLCAALLMDLAERAPLALVVHSGGKSLHGWFYCEGIPENRLEGFMQHAVELGGDSRTWLRSQFVRMPDGLRSGGQRQVAYYFNPGVLP
jgi:hypothetical protein